MKQYKAGDILLMAFPFSSGSSKRRPALVLADMGDNDVLVVRVTTTQTQTLYDTELRDWQLAGLLAPSVVRTDKLATLEKSLVERQLGSLTEADYTAVASTIQIVFSEWIR